MWIVVYCFSWKMISIFQVFKPVPMFPMDISDFIVNYYNITGGLELHYDLMYLVWFIKIKINRQFPTPDIFAEYYVFLFFFIQCYFCISVLLSYKV